MRLKINDNVEAKIADFFGIDANIINAYYKSLIESYSQNLKNSDSGFIYAEKFADTKFDNELSKKSWEQADLIGIDLPILIENKNSNGEIIMIVGIDPLRKITDFPNRQTDNIVIGTPYAIHSSFYREKWGRTKIYFDTIKYFFEKGYSVYLTDLFKIWMNNYDFGRNEKKNQRNCLVTK